MIPHDHCSDPNCTHDHNCDCNHDHNCDCHGEHAEMQSKYAQAFAKFDLHLHDEIVQQEAKAILSNHAAENDTEDVKKFLFSTIELTSLKVTDNEDNILKMVETINDFVNENPAFPHPAGICVYPRFVNLVSNSLEVDDMEISTVCGGNSSADCGSDVVISGSNICYQWSKYIERSTHADCLLQLHVGFNLIERHVTGTFNHNLNILLPCTLCKLSESYKLFNLAYIGSICKTAGTAGITK